MNKKLNLNKYELILKNFTNKQLKYERAFLSINAQSFDCPNYFRQRAVGYELSIRNISLIEDKEYGKIYEKLIDDFNNIDTNTTF